MAFESETKAAVLTRMLTQIPDNVDKRQGSVVYDMISPASIEFALAYIAMDSVLNAGFADTSYGVYLERRVAERGLTRKSAQKAKGILTFNGPDGSVIDAGTLVSTNGESPVYFVTDESATIAGGSVSVSATARDAGASGNIDAGLANTLYGDLVGIVTVTNSAYFTGGVNVESDADLLARYLEDVRRPATSGNTNQYRKWALEVPGVSDAKVYPIWNGAGTVKVVLLNDERAAPDESVITAAQTYIDPTQDGTGQGAAPVGALVTVTGASEIAINVSVDVTLSAAGSISTVKAQIESGLRDYFKELAFTDNVVRYTRIAKVISDAEHVVDYSNLTVNGGTENITTSDGQVPILGTVVAA